MKYKINQIFVIVREIDKLKLSPRMKPIQKAEAVDGSGNIYIEINFR